MNNVCNLCHSRPVMDRCSCCERCWYSGRYAREMEREADERLTDFARGAFDDDGFWRPLHD
jgi:hypothetical protein